MTYSVQNINVNKTWEVNIQSATISGTHSVDLSTGNIFKFNLSGDTVLNYTNAQKGSYTFLINKSFYDFELGTASNWLSNDTKDYTGELIISAIYDGQDMWVSKKGNDFKPTDISDNLLWLDANDESTFTLVSGEVDEWRDKSGNNKHFTAPSSSNRPIYDSVNRRIDTVYGEERWLTRGADNDMIIDGNMTLFLVSENINNTKVQDFAYNSVFISWSTNISAILARQEVGLRPSDDPYFEGFSGRNSSGGFTTARYSGVFFDVKHIHTSLWDGDDLYSYRNGVFKNSVSGTATARSTTHNECRIGRLTGSGSTGQLSQEIIHEIILYKRVLTESERLKVETYLKKKWNIQY